MTLDLLEQKRAIFVAEIVRRLRNCHIGMDWASKAKYILEYLGRMKAAGHSEKFRREITRRGIMKYLISVKNHEEGRPLYRSCEEREQQWAEIGGKPTAAS